MGMNDSRPDPDQLLARIQNEAQAAPHGKLKIFLGYAAGVGKTYAMLEAAHQRKNEGVDVVAGYIETHGRAETEELVKGLEVLPRLHVQYRDVSLTELDIDAALSRRPELLLVDELAHTNAPGCRHLKRYQDVEELLLAGIDVYTTLNIQHLESLNDVIAQITGVTVRETIPDSVIDEVTEIELVDLPPDELIDRLQAGKVYIPAQAVRAIQNFFRQGNLTALRELTMRRAAERVDDQMRAYMQKKDIPGPWPVTERLLVCVTPNPLGERLVRSARRLADELNAEWLAVYVENPNQSRLTQVQRERLSKTLRLAEELGGRSLTLPGNSVPETILNYAIGHNVSKVIAGKPLRPRWREILFGSVVDQLVRNSGDIDIYIISGEPQVAQPLPVSPFIPHRPWKRYIYAILLVLVAYGFSALTQPYISPTNLVMVYLLAVVIAASYLGRGPSILVTILGVLGFDFLFVPPFFTFVVSDTEYILTFIALLGVGLVISQLTARVRDQAEVAQRREAETNTLYELGRDLSIAEGLDEVIEAITKSVSQTFGRDVIILLPERDSGSGLRTYPSNPGYTPDMNEIAVATWAYQHGQQAGRGTDTLSAADARYFPLITANGVIGIIGVKPKDLASHLSPDQRRLLETFCSQAALAIERARLAEQAKYTQILQSAEQLQTALLNSISHDLRTPLVAITGALSSLADGGPAMDNDIRSNLLDTALQEADRMNRLVGNLLNMTRIEAGALQIIKQPGDIQDAVGTALQNLSERLGDRPIQINLPDTLPLIPMDFVLIVQVLVNLIDNSLKYSPAGEPIEIYAELGNQDISVKIQDHGPGIPQKDLERVFDKFYRVLQPESISGTGLGLSISKGIIESHGGRIWAENPPGGGTLITFTLPLENNIAS